MTVVPATIDWKRFPSGDLEGEKHGRRLTVRKHTDGTYWLLAWNSTNSGSVRVMVSANEEVAMRVAEKLAPDADLRSLAAAPHGFIKFNEGR